MNFKIDTLGIENSKQELKKHARQLNPDAWDEIDKDANNDNNVHCNALSGMRVQSNRGAFGNWCVCLMMLMFENND